MKSNQVAANYSSEGKPSRRSIISHLSRNRKRARVIKATEEEQEQGDEKIAVPHLEARRRSATSRRCPWEFFPRERQSCSWSRGGVREQGREAEGSFVGRLAWPWLPRSPGSYRENRNSAWPW